MVAPDDEGPYSISGTIVQNQTPIAGANVVLDSAVQTATTDADGRFRLASVPAGFHTLRIRAETDAGAFAERRFELFVSANVSTGDVKLPNPVHVVGIETLNETSLSLSWRKSDATDFREYKVYRANTAGLDEQTGTLVYVATARDDTTFVDGVLTPSSLYFYRVFVMNEFGRLGGSNLDSGRTGDVAMPVNGGFETLSAIDGWPIAWNRSLDSPDLIAIGVDSGTVYEGKYSLKFQLADNNTNYRFFVNTSIPASQLALGGTYRLSARLRTDRTNAARFTVDMSFSSGAPDFFTAGGVATESNVGPGAWYLSETEFTIPAALVTGSAFGLALYVTDLAPGPLTVWFDDVRIVRVR